MTFAFGRSRKIVKPTIAAPAVIINGSVIEVGEVVLSIAGAATVALTMFLIMKPRAHAPKVIHASRVSEA